MQSCSFYVTILRTDFILKLRDIIVFLIYVDIHFYVAVPGIDVNVQIYYTVFGSSEYTFA